MKLKSSQWQKIKSLTVYARIQKHNNKVGERLELYIYNGEKQRYYDYFVYK